MVEITREPISPQAVVNRVRTAESGCVVTYIGLIRQHSRGKRVSSVEYRDSDGAAARRLEGMVAQAAKRWPVEGIALAHRVGKLKVGEINLVIAVAAAHRQEGFAATQYLVDAFKEQMPTSKTETYQDD